MIARLIFITGWTFGEVGDISPDQAELLLDEGPYENPVMRLLDFLHMVHTDKHKPYFEPRKVRRDNSGTSVKAETAIDIAEMHPDFEKEMSKRGWKKQ
jgi:hypothetical protein